MRITQKQIAACEYIITFLGLFFYTGGLSTVLLDTFFLPRKIMTLMRYGILLPALIFLPTHLPQVKSALLQGKLAWVVTLMGMASFLWSIQPAIPLGTIRSELLPMSIFALYFAIRFPLKVQARIMALLLMSVSFISIFYAVAMPHIGQHGPTSNWPGAWKGIFLHKNTFGAFMTLTAGVVFSKIIKSKVPNLGLKIALGVLLLAAVVSGSMGSLIYANAICGIIFVLTKVRWRGKIGVLISYIALVGILMGYGVLLAVWDVLFTAIGKDPTLTGRTLIWEYIRIQLMANNPILGFGRGVIWKTSWFMYGVWAHAGDSPANAHNGFYDLALDVGYLGLLIFVVSYFINFSKAWKLAYRAHEAEYLWPIIFLIVLLMQNMLESLLMRGESFNWVIYLALSSSLDRWLHEKQWADQKAKRQGSLGAESKKSKALEEDWDRLERRRSRPRIDPLDPLDPNAPLPRRNRQPTLAPPPPPSPHRFAPSPPFSPPDSTIQNYNPPPVYGVEAAKLDDDRSPETHR